MNKVSILYVTHNQHMFFKSSVHESMRQQWKAGRAFEILVMLNRPSGNVDVVSRFFEKNFENYKSFKSDTYVPFGEAMNILAKEATGDVLVLVNDDAELDPFTDPVGEMLKCFERHPNAGVVGCKVMEPQTGRIQHAGIAFMEDGTPGHPFMKTGELNPLVNVEKQFQAVTFAAAAIKKSVFDELGGLNFHEERDQTKPYDYEDVDFCMRCAEKGYEVWYCPDARVYHRLAQTSTGYTQNKQENIFFYKKDLVEKWGPKMVRNIDEIQNTPLPNDTPKVLIVIPFSEFEYWLKDIFLHNLLELEVFRENTHVLFAINNCGPRMYDEMFTWAKTVGKDAGFAGIYIPEMVGYNQNKNKIIVDMRNLAREHAKKIGASHVFYWDNDVILPRDTIKRLLAINTEKHPVTTGVVWYKLVNPTPMLFLLRDDVPNVFLFEEKLKQLKPLEAEFMTSDYKERIHHLGPFKLARELIDGGVHEVGAAGNGCLLVRTDVTEKISYEAGTDYKLFPYYGTEDLVFFSKLAKLGIKTLVDTSIQTHHIAKGTIFDGHRGSYMKGVS